MTTRMKTLSSLIITLFSIKAVCAAPGYNQGASIPQQYDHIINAQNYGVIANDGKDDTLALQTIIDQHVINSNNELTLLQLPQGTIIISDEIHIDKSGLVIRGAGADPDLGTKIVARSWAPYTIDPSNAPDFDKKYWPGFGVFRVETRQKHSNEQNYEGSINFHWKHAIELVQTASQGTNFLKLKAGKANQFSVGDLIYVGAANNEAFLDQGEVPESRRNAGHIKNGHMRTQLFNVISVDSDNDIVKIDRPLEFDIPLQSETGYKSRVMPVTAVRNFGLQDFYLTLDKQSTACKNNNPNKYSASNPMGALHRYENLCPQDAIHGVILKWAHNGWIDNLNIEMIGSHPIVTEFAKDITISNNKLNGSWNKGAGGNGYLRGSKLYDSWVHHNDIRNIRHLAIQWSATGNIIEHNYLNVDLNLHGGWERNNLIRHNTIEVPYEHRNWSHGAPESGSTWQPIWVGSGDHASKWSGPTGPNNIFIDNRLKKAKSPDATMTKWGLFDQAGVEYAINWDGNQYKHFNIDNQPASTWNQNIAEGVFNQIPNSGVNTSGGSWNRPIIEPDEPVEPIDPPSTAQCQTVKPYPWKSELEMSIQEDQCLEIDRDLKGKTIQVWDSDADSSCDFRGYVESMDGTGTTQVTSNYHSNQALSGTILKFTSTNGCNALKFRAY